VAAGDLEGDGREKICHGKPGAYVNVYTTLLLHPSILYVQTDR
jgi:hypothetical protein